MTGVLCGQGLEVHRVKHNDGVAVLKHGQVGDDATLAGGGDLQPVDTGEQHARIGGRGVVHEPGRVDVVQDAAAGRIRAGHCGQSAGVNVDGPCAGAAFSSIQRFGLLGVKLLSVGHSERPVSGLTAQCEYLHIFGWVCGVGFNTCEQLAGQAACNICLALGRCCENDLITGFQRGSIRYQCRFRCFNCKCRHRQQRDQHEQRQQSA